MPNSLLQIARRLRRFFLLTLTVPALFLALSSPHASAASRPITTLDTAKLLGGKQACVTAGGSNVKFLSNDKLLILAGSGPSCYKSIDDLELVVLSLDGKVIATKPWRSTFPSVVLDGERVAIAEAHSILVLNAHLEAVQTVWLPHGLDSASVYLSRLGADILVVRSPMGTVWHLRGNPLEAVPTEELPKSNSQEVSIGAYDGITFSYSPKSLFRTPVGGLHTQLASLAWVNPCARFCQEYEAELTYSLALQGKPRILFLSNGSRFPITDAAGLFPYCRIQVFDLSTGAEVFRREFVTKTGERSAQLSQDGSLIALSQDSHIALERLP